MDWNSWMNIFRSHKIRLYLRRKGINYTIPRKSNQTRPDQDRTGQDRTGQDHSTRLSTVSATVWSA